MGEKYILAVDQGTSATKAIIIDSLGRIVSKATSALQSYYSHVGFVEQDPKEIHRSTLDSVGSCFESFLKDGSRRLEDITC